MATLRDAFREERLLWTLVRMLDWGSAMALRQAVPDLGGGFLPTASTRRLPTMDRMPLLRHRLRSLREWAALRHWQLHSTDALGDMVDRPYYALPTDMYRVMDCQPSQGRVPILDCAFLAPEAPPPYRNALLLGIEDGSLRVYLLKKQAYKERRPSVRTGLNRCAVLTTSPGGTAAAIVDGEGHLSVVIFGAGRPKSLLMREKVAWGTRELTGERCRRAKFVDERTLVTLDHGWYVLVFSIELTADGLRLWQQRRIVTRFHSSPHPSEHFNWYYSLQERTCGEFNLECGSNLNFVVLPDFCGEQGHTEARHCLQIILAPGTERELAYNLFLGERICDFVLDPAGTRLFVTVLTPLCQDNFKERSYGAQVAAVRPRERCHYCFEQRGGSEQNLGVLEVNLENLEEPPRAVPRFFVPSNSYHSKQQPNLLCIGSFANVFYVWRTYRSECNRRFLLVTDLFAVTLLFPLEATVDAAPFYVSLQPRIYALATSAEAGFAACVTDSGLLPGGWRQGVMMAKVCRHHEEFCQAEMMLPPE
jgi:hypothetical protein